MISFALRGIIADIDETTPDEPGHPATVLVMEVGDTFETTGNLGVFESRRTELVAYEKAPPQSPGVKTQ
jgi:hypothetical protein